jgi:hypothetical protein
MLKWLQCLRRGHRPEFVRNVYGDEILMLGKRSIWRCGHCERWLYRDELHTPDGVSLVDDQPNGPQSPLEQKEGPACRRSSPTTRSQASAKA